MNKNNVPENDDTVTRQGSGNQPRLRDVLLGALVMLAVANASHFLAVDGRVSNRYKALYRDDTADVLSAGLRESSRHRDLFGLAIALAKLAPGSVIILPADGAYARNDFRGRMYAFGEIDRIEYRSYNERRFMRDLDVSKYIVASGKGSDREPAYSIAMKSESSREFVLLRRNRGEQLLLDTSLIPQHMMQGLGE